MTARFVAVDLGAESGRVMSGRLTNGVLDLVEVARVRNEPIRESGTLRWDAQRLWLEIQRALERLEGPRPDSIAVDAWGCDYGLVGAGGHLLENPYHYRDARTDGVMEDVGRRIGRDRIYSVTGIQFLPFNTLYQLVAACRKTPESIAASRAIATIPDLFNFWLTGELRAELTNATTTQCVDARARTWAVELLDELGIPSRLFLPVVPPGHLLGAVTREASPSLAGVPVVVPACHDTGSAFASVSCGSDRALLSSGTWSLLGAELPAPVITADARDLNFTNEGGVCGTTRFLKNIAGLWMLQACLRSWAVGGRGYAYDDLLTAAREEPAFRSLVDPDHATFLRPEDMTSAIAAYCRGSGQPEPASPAQYSRAILESLAFKYRMVLESLERLTERRFDEIRIVGGGSRNELLNQFTADATGRVVTAGPVEATTLGNIAMQMVATGAVDSLSEARNIVDRSFPVRRYQPRDTNSWDAQSVRFQERVEMTCRAR